MKLIVLTLIILFSIKCSPTGKSSLMNDNAFPWEFCTVTEAVQGFFTGTEKDPSVTNSRCVAYFPTLVEQFNTFINGANMTLLNPQNFFGWIQQGVTLINRYSLWQNYCQFATMFTQLDNTIENVDGFVALLYRFIYNQNKIQERSADFFTYLGREDCSNTFKSAGGVFSLLFDFNVPEDII